MSKLFRFVRTSVLLAALLTCLLLISCDGECPHLLMEREPIAPDCTSEGYTLNRCKSCGYEYKSNFIAPTGHEITGAPTNPSCTEQGYTVYSCANCDYAYTTDYTAPRGHSLHLEKVEPTCDAQGYTEYKCDCGYAYRANVTAALGHNVHSAVYAPSCDGVGHTDNTCLRCSLAWTSDITAPTGHDFAVQSLNVTPAVPEGYSIHTCRECGFSYSDALYYSELFTGAYAPSNKPLAQGVDISKWNHQIDEDGNYLPLDFNAIREAGFSFVILKAGSTPWTNEKGELKGGIDPVFEMNYAAAKAAGLDVGVYFYTYSTTVEDTRRDTEMLLEWLDGKQLEYPVYFDVEDAEINTTLSREQIGELCITFISILQEHRYFGAVYTNNNWLVNYHDTAKILYLFDVWYARYPLSSDGTYTWNTSSYGRHTGMWQYTYQGRIPAISETTDFDFNYAYKDYPTIMRDFGYNGYPIPSVQ